LKHGIKALENFLNKKYNRIDIDIFL